LQVDEKSELITVTENERNVRKWSKQQKSMVPTSEKLSPLDQAGTRRNSIWKVWLSTFLTIFLAEMGDKTQLATMLMSAQSTSPLSVLLGASLALIATSLLGVTVGRWLSRTVPPAVLDTLAAMLMILIAILLLGEAIEG
jgi:Ca2+/H+ antiporter, TMEM165/GDT1 family